MPNRWLQVAWNFQMWTHAYLNWNRFCFFPSRDVSSSFSPLPVRSFVAHSDPPVGPWRHCILIAHALAFPWSHSFIAGCLWSTCSCMLSPRSVKLPWHASTFACREYILACWMSLYRCCREDTSPKLGGEDRYTTFFFLEVGNRGTVLFLVALQESDSYGNVHRRREKV